jgi:hypothetical protein
VEHRLREPASVGLLKEFSGCPAATQVVEFYTGHDGGVLFQDPDSDAASKKRKTVNSNKKLIFERCRQRNSLQNLGKNLDPSCPDQFRDRRQE